MCSLSLSVSSHVHTVRNLMSYHGNKTNFIKDEYHIGDFRGYGAMMDDKYITQPLTVM